jgi:hypothetical protein
VTCPGGDDGFTPEEMAGFTAGARAGFTAGVGAGVNAVGTGVVVPDGLSVSTHPADVTRTMRRPVNKIIRYFIVYPLPVRTKT